MNEITDALVIGAGISGLTYAHYLGAADCLVLEAQARAGGLVQTLAEPEGLRHELGPETISDPEGSARELLDDLGLGLSRAPSSAMKRFLVRDGALREIPMNPAKLLLGNFLPLATRLRLLAEPFAAAHRALEGSVADFMLHRVGRGVLETLVDPMLSGIHAAAPEELSMRACFPQLVAGVERHGSLFAYLRARSRAAPSGATSAPWKPAGGMGRLPERLAERLGGRLCLNTQVDSIEALGEGWRVSAAGQHFDARRLILALPQAAAAKLLSGVAPGVASALAGAMNESLCVHVAAHRVEDVEHALDGFGYLVPSRAGLRHLGTLFSSSLDPGGAPAGVVLLRTLLGGSRWPEVHRESHQAIESLVKREVHPLLGIRGPALFSRTTHHVRALPRYDLRQPERVKRLEAALPRGLHLLGNHLHGIGIPALIRAARQLAEAHRALDVRRG